MLLEIQGKVWVTIKKEEDYEGKEERELATKRELAT